MNMRLRQSTRARSRRMASLCAAVALGVALPASAATILHLTFEGSALGSLPASWTVTSAGSGSATIVNTTDHGHVLRLQGSRALGEYLIASRGFSSSATQIGTQVDIRPDTGASFLWILNGAGSSIGRRRIRLQLQPGTTVLQAQTVPSGTTSCGTLRGGVWSRVMLVVNTQSHSFDVLINGQHTACTGVAADIQPPFNSVSVMDASNENWGGVVRFDNIDVATP